MCSQDSLNVELHRRSNDWRAEYFTSGGDMTFESVDMTVSIDALYNFLLTRHDRLMALAGAIDEETANELLNEQSTQNQNGC